MEPIDEYSDDQYAEGILTTARLLGPEILRRWGALESFDVCQEHPAPRPSTASRTSRPTRTLDMTTPQVEALDWDSLTLAELLAVASDQAR